MAIKVKGHNLKVDNKKGDIIQKAERNYTRGWI